MARLAFLTLATALLLSGEPAAAAKRRQRLKDGDRAACLCHAAGFVVDAAERACAAPASDDLLELCTPEELATAAASGVSEEAVETETEAKPPPPPPPPAARSMVPGPSKKALSPKHRAALVADHVVKLETPQQLTELVAAYTIVLLTVGAEGDAIRKGKPCKPCAVLAPNLKLAAANVNASWGQDTYADHGTAVFALASGDSLLGQALAVTPTVASLPTMFLYVDGGDPVPEVGGQTDNTKPHKRAAVSAAAALQVYPRGRMDAKFRGIIWNEQGLSGYMIDELEMAESRRMMNIAPGVDPET